MNHPLISTGALLQQLRWRYATKSFDPTRKIPAAVWAALEDALILTPTSYGFQPYRFVVVTGQSTKDRLVAQSWNQQQPAQCSHLVVFAAKASVNEADVDHYLARVAEVRGVPVTTLDPFRKILIGDIVAGPRNQWQHEWAARQAYIALGNFMTTAAAIGVDACPMEGIAPAQYDEILGLVATGYRTVVACAAGYRAGSDPAASLPKVRFPAAELIIRI